MNQPDTYNGKSIVVLGLAKSGYEVAKRFHALGANVTVNDKKERHLCPEASELEALGICVVLGGHPEGLIHEQVSLVVKNPGIPYSAEPVQQALALGIEVITEIEVGYLLCQAPIIGITGSNGKTTTTTWVGNMLEAAGLRPLVAGNIGTPFSGVAPTVDAEQTVVLELSSFQLKGTTSFRPRVAALLNMVETHLDYHGSMEDYVESKLKMFANMTQEDVAVLNAEDATCRLAAERIRARARVWEFSSRSEVEVGAYVIPAYGADGTTDDTPRDIVFRDEAGKMHRIISVHELGLPGRYNVDNALAACAIAIAAGARPEQLVEPLRQFKGVEHRLEWVCERNGVQYFNNSKATNTIATQMALDAFPGSIVLIAGGLDRGLDFKELIPYFKERVKAVVTMGQTREILRNVAEQAGLKSIHVVDNMDDAALAIEEAVREAEKAAQAGDIILLSPACASWDMFPSYEERGRMFKEAVHSLK